MTRIIYLYCPIWIAGEMSCGRAIDALKGSHLFYQPKELAGVSFTHPS